MPFLVVALVIVTGVLGVSTLQLGIDMSFRPLFKDEAHDPANDRFEATFGQPSGAYIIALVDGDDLSGVETLKSIQLASSRIRSLDHVVEVLSLGAVDTGSVEDAIGSKLLSADEQTTIIAARLDLPLEDLDGRRRVIDEFKSIVREVLTTYDVRFTGVSVVEAAYADLVLRYLFLSVALTTAAIALVLVWEGGWSGALVALAGVSFACPATLGLMHLMGQKLTIVNSMVPTLVLIIGVADAIHMKGAFLESNRSGIDRVTATRQMFARMLIPCIATTLTTAAGALALLSAEIRAIADFGVCVAVGVGAAFVANQLLVPFLLERIPVSVSRRMPLSWVTKVSTPVVVFSALVLAAVSAAGVTMLSTNQRFNAELADDHPVRMTQARYEAAFGGFLGPEIMFSTLPADTDLARLETELNNHVDVLRVSRLVNDRNLALQVRTTDMGSERADSFVSWLKGTVKTSLGEDVKFDVVGQWWLAQQGMASIIRDAAVSFSIAFIVVIPFLVLVTRRWRLLAIGVVANLLPVLVGLGFMGLTGIPLRIGTTLVLAVALGIAVDDSVHIVARLQRELNRKKRGTDAVAAAVQNTGRSLIVTTVALLAGFASMWINPLLAIRDMGLVAVVILLTALFADLVLLPACVRQWYRTPTGPGRPAEPVGSVGSAGR